MLKYATSAKDGGALLMLGISAEDVRRIKRGAQSDVIYIGREQLRVLASGRRAKDWPAICLFYGETEERMIADLQEGGLLDIERADKIREALALAREQIPREET